MSIPADRLRDLVRQMRHPLHQEDLITDEEYAELVLNTPGAVARLESYDDIRARLTAANSEIAELRTQLAAAPIPVLTAEQVLHEMDEYCTRVGNMDLAKGLRDSYQATGKMAPAILKSLRISPIVRYQKIAPVSHEPAAIGCVCGGARWDTERLEYLNATEALIVHSKDGDTCHLMWPYRNEDDLRVQPGTFNSFREAIDEARAGMVRFTAK